MHGEHLDIESNSPAPCESGDPIAQINMCGIQQIAARRRTHRGARSFHAELVRSHRSHFSAHQSSDPNFHDAYVDFSSSPPAAVAIRGDATTAAASESNEPNQFRRSIFHSSHCTYVVFWRICTN